MTRWLAIVLLVLACSIVQAAPVQTNYDYGYPDVNCNNVSLGGGAPTTCTFHAVPVTGYSTYTLTFVYVDSGAGACTGYTAMLEGAVRQNPNLATTTWGHVTTNTVAGGTIALNPATVSRTVDATETSHFTFAGPYYQIRVTFQGIGGAACLAADRLSVLMTVSIP